MSRTTPSGPTCATCTPSLARTAGSRPSSAAVPSACWHPLRSGARPSFPADGREGLVGGTRASRAAGVDHPRTLSAAPRRPPATRPLARNRLRSRAAGPAVPAGLNHINDATPPHPPGRQAGSCQQSSPGCSRRRPPVSWCGGRLCPLARHRLGGLGMEPTRLFPIIVLLSLVTVEYGGWSLLGFLTGHGTLGPFREQFFRAGHAHAGVLLVLSLAYFVYLGRAGYSTGVQWLAGALLLVGVLAQSGGFFVHLGLGQQGRSSPGTVLTRAGALLIAAALLILAVGLITHG